MAKRLYLASQSPRRLDLLRQIGFTPVVLPLRHGLPRTDVDETPLPREKAADYVCRLAQAKAEAGLRALMGRNLPEWPIVAADTTVTLDRKILGKPATDEEAGEMLWLLSNRTHTVLTAVGVAYMGLIRVALNTSKVRFAHLTEAQIAAYVASREPFDKAGGYGVQGRAALFVRHLCGSYSGVMGLPLYETAELLRGLGYEIP
jgi:nucleoside triphosphate pyrophosphatase